MNHASKVAGAVQFLPNEDAWVEAFVKHHSENYKEFEDEDLPYWEATKTWNLCNWQGSDEPRFIVNLLQRFAPENSAEECVDTDYDLLKSSVACIRTELGEPALIALMTETLNKHVLRAQRLYEKDAISYKIKMLKRTIEVHDECNFERVSQLNNILTALARS